MQWIKDGQIFNGKLKIDGADVFFDRNAEPDPELMRSLGWEEYTPPPPPPKRYSKRKIIIALGLDAWADKRAELEAAGVYELFSQSTYLCVDDETFAAIYSNLTAEEKRILDEECLYDE